MAEGEFQHSTPRAGEKPRLVYSSGSGTGGHDGDGSMIEMRVARLEDDVKELKIDIKAIRVDVAELKGKVSMLPGYGGIALIVGLIVGLSTLAQVAARYLPTIPTP